MNLLDLLIVAAAIGAAAVGYRLGFVARAVSWAGLGLGLFLATRLVPPVVRSLHARAQPRGLLLVAILLLIFGAFAGQALGLLVGAKLQVAVRSRAAKHADRVAGAAAGFLGVIAAVWLLAPAMATVPGWAAHETRRSAVIREVHQLLPRAPDTSRSLRHLLSGGYPDVLGAFNPAPALGPPPAASGISLGTAQRIAASTVKIDGDACSYEQEGSGFVVAPGLVATNAHVVAGERATTVIRSDGQRLRAVPVAFDPNRDVALLSVAGLDRPPLPLEPSRSGQRGGVFGHPHGGPLTVSPFSVGSVESVQGNDIYGEHATTRSVLFLASDLAPGDSGGALVTPDGTVVGMAFAIAPDRPGVAYALDTKELVAVLRTVSAARVPLGACASD